MNYLIIDTEKTYDVGLVVFNDKGIIFKEEIVIKNNFEDRAICAENNYKRKMKRFETTKPNIVDNPIEAIRELNHIYDDYHIQKIFAHNAAEDRIQIAQLYKQAYTADNKFANIYDSLSIVKILFPTNINYGLEDIITDILGIDAIQLHTALDDALWLSGILVPLYSYLDLLTNYEYLFSREVVMQDLLKSINILLDLTVDKVLFEYIHPTSYTIKSLNTKLKLLVEHKLLMIKIVDKYGKNGNLLKTKDTAYVLTPLGKQIIQLYQTFSKLDYTKIITPFLIQVVRPTLNSKDSSYLEIFEKNIKKEYELKYNQQVNLLNNSYQQNKNFLEQEFRIKNNQLAKDYADKDTQLTKTYEQKCNQFVNPTVCFFTKLHDKNYKKQIKALNKDLKKNIISIETYIWKILEL